MNILNINFIYIENTFIYKLKDYIKDISSKKILDFNDLTDKSFNKLLIFQNKKLLGSLILKKLNKIINKELITDDGELKENATTEVYYVLESFSDNLIFNINKNIKHFYKGEIVYTIYTDKKNINNNNISKVLKLDSLKK